MNGIFVVVLVIISTLVRSATSQLDSDAHQLGLIRVTLTLEDPEGSGLAGAMVALAADDVCLVDSITDADGKATLEAVIDSRQLIDIRHAFARPSSLSNQDQIAATKRLAELRESYHLVYSHRLDILPDKTNYDMVLTAWPGVDVRAVIIDEKRQVQDGLIFGPPLSLLGSIEHGRTKPLRSIRKGHACTIAVCSYVSWPATIIRPIQLDENRTTRDVDLGEVQIARLSNTVPVDIAIVGELDGVGNRYLPGVTLVSMDAAMIVSYRALPQTKDSGGVTRLLADASGSVLVPPGEFYVVPGAFSYTEDQIDVISALLEGKNLHDSPIPRICIDAHGANEFGINVRETHEAIRSAMKERH